jgi:flagellar hook-associated protein 3 FlgL
MMTEVRQIRDNILSLGNSQLNGTYLFSGFKNDSPPFDAGGVYSGGADEVRVPIDRTNTIAVNYPGGKLLRGAGGGTDVIATLDNLLTAMQNNDVAGIQATINPLDSSINQVLSARTDIGARTNRLEMSESFIDDTRLNLKKVISSKQDVDFIQAVSDMTRQQTAFEAALATTSKISKMSLLDYL